MTERSGQATSGLTFPLSYEQQRLWSIEQLIPGTALYSIPKILRLRGALDVPALRRSLEEMVRRHHVLRTTFAMRGESPVQVVQPAGSVEMPVTRVDPISEGRAEEALLHALKEEINQPFDLASGPLFRASIFQVSETEHVLSLIFHHAVFDGWSARVFLRELSALYGAFVSGRTSPLDEPAFQYVDYAARSVSGEGDDDSKSLDYWREQLAGELPTLTFPAVRPRPVDRTPRGGTVRSVIDRAAVDRLAAISSGCGVTLFMALLAVYKILLRRFNRTDDILVGCPFAGRTRPGQEDMIGFFVNTLALRTRVTPDMTFASLLQSVRATCLEAFAHQDIPFQHVVEAVSPERRGSLTPLFETIFTFEDTTEVEHKLGGLCFDFIRLEPDVALTDVVVRAERGGEGLDLLLSYSSDILDADAASGILDRYGTLLRGVVADPERRVGELPFLAETEREKLLSEWSGTRTNYPRDATLAALFEEQASGRPEAVAVDVVGGGQRLTYGELDRRANGLASQLAALGVGVGEPVGLCAGRTPEMVVGMLGILKAGGAYVPLDPGYPDERIGFMIEDSGMRVLVTGERSREGLPPFPGQVVDLNADPRSRSERVPFSVPTVGAGDLAYIMYTSGSTGKPKGAAIPQRAVVRLVKNTHYIELGPGTAMLGFAPISFDASTLELWGPLLNGGRVVLYPAATPTVEELGGAIRESGVNTLWLTAELFRLVVEERLDDLRGVKQLLAGGDVLPVGAVRRVLAELPDCRLVNGYGPTENTTFTCCYDISAGRRVDPGVPIGRPVANTTVYILDEQLQPLPAGVAGRLYTGGDGLAREYWRRPALTAERFVPDPFSEKEGARLYDTGDLARWSSDGVVEFLGRADRQVKIRGFRVEPGEIENALLDCRPVEQGAVTVVGEARESQRLAAFCVLQEGQSVTPTDLRKQLRETLPDYMIPQVVVVVGALPLTASGKIDRDALPLLLAKRQSTGGGAAVPRTATERALAAIWGGLLGRAEVGADDNFLDLGGHSLLAIRAAGRMEKKMGVRVNPTALLFNTLEQVAALCDAQRMAQGPTGGSRPQRAGMLRRLRQYLRVKG